MSQEWLSPEEVAALPFVRRRVATVRKHAREGVLPGQRDLVSGRWRFKLSVVRETYGADLTLAADVAAIIDAEVRRVTHGDGSRKTKVAGGCSSARRP